MRFPKMRPQAAMELKVPDLAGGMNLRDGLSEVLDNQLTDCKNMWWQDGVLKTRPGAYKIAAISTIGYDEKIRPKQTNIYIGQYRLFFYNISGTRKSETNDYSVDVFGETGFWLQKNDEIIELPTLEHKLANFVCQKNNTIYAFCENWEIWKMEFDNDYDAPTTKGGWVIVSEEDYYIPIVYAHCTAVDFTGTQVEGFNLIGNKFKMIYSTINPNLKVTASDGSGNVSVVHLHEMIYPFPEGMITNPEDYIGKEVKAIITNENGIKETHTAVFTSVFEQDGEVTIEGTETNPESGLVMMISNKGIDFWWDQGGGIMEPATIPADAVYIEDNLEIIMPYVPTAEEKAKIFNMTRCEWFGGAASGIAGGTRLFLCGNSGDEKSLVCWSGLNNPLYFPENSYFYVGDTTSAVTGFGKQTDKLVIFKENETWLTYYQQNENIDAQSLINQSVIDYASSSVYFPLVQVNSAIGCSCPDTIQLCRNRLVWLGNNGNIYTLVSESQYNERSIFCVSEMVKNRLKDYSDSFYITSCDWNGYYCLCFDNRMYLMDYNCYGYTHIASYSKTEDANIRIPWWYWELPNGEYNNEEAIAVMSSGTRLYIIFYPKEPNGLFSEFSIKKLSTDFNTDDGENIPSMIRTKLFDFGQPSVRKNVDKINLQLGNNGGDIIRVKVITECGEEEHDIMLTGNETQSYTPGYIESKAIFPCIRQTVKIGLELSSTGVLAIDGLSFKYRQTGGCR